MLTVVAALIESEGRLLVCQRRRGGAFELLWEFPGGKIQPSETPQAALARELREELGVTAKIGREIYRTQHRYEEMPEPLELIFFAASAPGDEIRNLVFEQMEWREPRTLSQLHFLPADRELIDKLAAGEINLAEPIRPPSDR
ncbi:MAG TPA: (deoxy)nucleoside triphosphate pyrophosphohydrolase [Candidatus Acidoferrales bacterium]|jgi:8-oxo-dGTP diphosphatase|nr:(deoxy)nucleoside triphosphate pyrophosphohydrolase [Candidatus Acidoferrales bacterium]